MHSVAKYQTTQRREPLGKWKKVTQCRKKIERGNSLVPSCFVGYLEKVHNERGPFRLSLPWPDLALGGFRIVFKKWTDQCDDCSLKRKKVTAIVGHFFLKGWSATRNRNQAVTQEKNYEVSARGRLARNAKYSAKRLKTDKIASGNIEALNDDDNTVYNIGIADVPCEFREALKVSIESNCFCCRRGNVVLPQHPWNFLTVS